jgi:hypothetical protein
MLAAVSAKRVVLPFLLLLAVLFIDHFFVRSVFSELDILEHFIFGFIISEAASRIALSGGGWQNGYERGGARRTCAHQTSLSDWSCF